MIVNENKLFAGCDILSIDSAGDVIVKVHRFTTPIITAAMYYDSPFVRRYIYIDYQKHHNLKFIKKERLC